MLFSSIIFVFFASYSVCAVQLNIYNSVTEVRQQQSGVGSYDYSFTNSEYGNVIDGTVSWDGTPFVKQEIYKIIDTLKDASVIVRSTCDCKTGTIKAIIVDPHTMLLKNVATGGYFYADSRSIEYSKVRPDDGGTTVTFEFKNPSTKFNGTFSYLMRGITWSPDYDLLIQDQHSEFFYSIVQEKKINIFCICLACNLRAFANIRNNQAKEYQVGNTYLYSGDLQLVSGNSFNPVYAQAFKGPVAAMASPSSIQLNGEQKGFYAYSLKDQYTLLPQSTVRLPFITVNSKCNFYYKAITSVSNGEYNGLFQRNYDMIVDQFLPSGIVTVRDNGILIGQSSLPDVPVNYTQTITLGEDHDVQYSVQGTIVASTNDGTIITSQTYELNVTIFNYKDKDVSGELDFYGSSQTTLNKTTCSSTKLDTNTIKVPFQVKTKQQSNCRITATLKW